MLAKICFCAFLGRFILYSVESTPLDDYVWAPDENYKYEWLQDATYNISISNTYVTVYMLNMTSQRWLTDADFAANSTAKSIWWHYLAVVVPEKIAFKNNGSLYITKGFNDMGIPGANESIDYNIWAVAALALLTGQVTGALFQIPNQDIIYASDPKYKRRSEDEAIAFTWAHFLNDPTLPLGSSASLWSKHPSEEWIP